MKGRERVQPAEHQPLLLRLENVEVDHGVGVGLADQLQVVDEVLLPVVDFVYRLLQLDLLHNEQVIRASRSTLTCEHPHPSLLFL